MFLAGLLLMFAGILITISAPLLYLASGHPAAPRPAEIAGGACIVVFFVPICFGYGSPQLVQALSIFGLLMALIALLAMLALRKGFRAPAF